MKERKQKEKTYYVSYVNPETNEEVKVVCDDVSACETWIITNGITGIVYEIGYYVKVATKQLKTYTKLS